MGRMVNRTPWVPIVALGSPGGDLTVAYTVQNGIWSQTDSIVVAGFDLGFTPTYTSAPGVIQIRGWPEAPPLADSGLFNGSIRFSTGFTWPAGVTQITPTIGMTVAGVPSMSLIGVGSGLSGGATNILFSLFTSGSPFRMQGTITMVLPP